MSLEAGFVLRRAGAPPVADQRLALLEAIDREGSISAAARAVGLSYKAAWDAVHVLNNLFLQPLVDGRAGGAQGGGARLTAAGTAVVQMFRDVQRELQGFFERFSAQMTQQATSPAAWAEMRGALFGGLALKTSARNALRGVVESVVIGAVNAEVTLRVSPQLAIVAIVTRHSVAELALQPGREAVALVKSSFVILAPAGEVGRTSARNALRGQVAHCEDGAVSSEITVDLGDGKTLVAVVTRDSAQSLDFQPGDAVVALIKAPHVILAVD